MNFSDLILHPAVASALATRGYETATPVQAAVLDARCVGRDLLVSSQTGSGKTVAFGAALVQTLLGDGSQGGHAAAGEAGPPQAGAPNLASARGASGGHPLALVVVPTRELAVQVRDELGWLLKQTGLKMASFTGGTAVSGDLRALQKGVDLVIGTPGRLCDLLRRQRLELANIRVVILDEADEMLDLGFREDLQTLLQAAPDTRRTLMLSATLPPEIRALARRFQRDALPIDPRKDAGATVPGAHDDITYVAHLISSADRLAVVVNVLRSAGTGRAIVFCTTREGVSRLHAALVARGFAATAISGDRAQAERDRALDLLRRGDARVLVATNVAARGLHLPDVDLIVHADLPLNADSLTHRSGRTGRAGRKGTAVVIASVSERRKAERLLMSAHVPVVWTPPPSAETITAAARNRLAEDLLRDEADADDAALRMTPAVEELAGRLEAKLSASATVSAPVDTGDRSLAGGRTGAIRGAAADGIGAHRSVRRPRRTVGTATRARRIQPRRRPVSCEYWRERKSRSALAVAAHLPPRRRHTTRSRRHSRRADRHHVRDRGRRRSRFRARRQRDRSAGPTRDDRAGASPGRQPLPRLKGIDRVETLAASNGANRGAAASTRARAATRARARGTTESNTRARATGASNTPARATGASGTPAHTAATSKTPARAVGASSSLAGCASASNAPAPCSGESSTRAPCRGAANTYARGIRISCTRAADAARARESLSPEKRSPSITLATEGATSASRSDRPGRPKTQIPVIEMKHAHRQSGGHRDHKNEDRPRAAQPERPQPVEPRRTRDENRPRGGQPDRPQAGGPRHTRNDNHARAAQPNRPRTDGTNPAKRTSPPPSAFSPSVPARAPFWKDGARRRPVAPAPGPGSPAKKHKGG